MLACAFAFACGPSGEPRPCGPRPNVVLVVLDTVRQDHMSCYGYSRPNTPNLERLATQSILFDNAYSVGSWTAPAHASLFTGLLPATHGSTQERWRLAEGFETLAELLGRHGYRTWAVVDNPVLDSTNGYARGFERYVETWRLPEHPSEDHAVIGLRRLLDQRAGDEPFFLFLNMIEPHNPFDSSRQFLQRFVGRTHLEIVGHDPRAFYLGERTYDDAELDYLKGLYDAEILYVDWVVGRLVAELESRGSWDDTLLVVTSDHGENIGDHEHVGHLFSLYESTVKIPLLLRYPPALASGVRDPYPAQLIDVLPTLAGILGLPVDGLHGVDLRDRAAREDRPLLLEYYRPVQALLTFGADGDDPRLDPYRRRLRAVVHRGRKLIVAEDGQVELFDLTRDPDELNVLDDPRLAGELEVELERLVGRYGSAGVHRGFDAPVEPDAATLEALRSLGYVD